MAVDSLVIPPHPTPIILTKHSWVPEELGLRLKQLKPNLHLAQIMVECFRHLPPQLAWELFDSFAAVSVLEGGLELAVIRKSGKIEEIGHVGYKLIVDAAKTFLRDDFNGGSPDVGNINYHAIGTGSTAPAAGDTALQTELTTQYNPDNTRATGTKSVPASNQFRTVGTNTVDASVSITEWGLLSQAATGGGTLWDRQTFTAVALASGDSLQSTYTLTIG